MLLTLAQTPIFVALCGKAFPGWEATRLGSWPRAVATALRIRLEDGVERPPRRKRKCRAARWHVARHAVGWAGALCGAQGATEDLLLTPSKPRSRRWCEGGLPLTLANPLVFVAPCGGTFPGLEATRPKDYARAVVAFFFVTPSQAGVAKNLLREVA